MAIIQRASSTVFGLDGSITDLQNADITLQSNIDAEETRALAAEGVLTTGLGNLSGVTDATTARTNLGVYSTTEVDSAINAASLALGSNYSTDSHVTAGTDFGVGSLTVGDNVFITDDGDTKWAIYKITVITDGAWSTSTKEKIMDEDVYLIAQSASSIKTTYESNANTNAFEDEEKLRVGKIGSSATVLTTTATEILPAINELDAAIDGFTTAYQAYADAGDATTLTTVDGLIGDATVDGTVGNTIKDRIATSLASAQTYADTAEADAITTANAYTDTREVAITTAYQTYADTAEADAVTTANAYTDGLAATVFQETLLVTGDSITLTHTPLNGVILNFGTVRNFSSPNGNAFDIPVSGTGKAYTLSGNSVGQFDGENVIIQYMYNPTV